MKILVSSNCQTGGVGGALAKILPDLSVEMHNLPNLGSDQAKRDFAQKLHAIDVWVTSGGFDIPEKFGFGQGLKIVQMPAIVFNAFHPDCVYVRHKKTGSLTDVHYNSGIVAWGYRNRLTVEETTALFTSENFENLGFFSMWDAAVDELKTRFKSAELDFDRFFLRIKRGGCFMHSLNHPKAFVLTELSKQLARKIADLPTVPDSHVEMNDGLMHANWPIYREIGQFYSVQANGYAWKIKDTHIPTLEDYVKFCFGSYASQGFEPEDIEIFASPTNFNETLNRKTGRA